MSVTAKQQASIAVLVIGDRNLQVQIRRLRMHYTELVIDDNYINEVAEYFETQGKQLQRKVDSYIAALKRVTEEGVVEGETSDALKSFLEYAEKLNQVVSATSVEVRDTVMNYLEEIDTQDQYLY